MLSQLVKFSLSQRLFVLLTTLIVAGGGWYAYRGLPIDAFPDVSSTQVKIIMKAPGMTPEEVESRIAIPIEVEMLGIPKTRILRSVTKYGLVDVTIDFEDGTDIFWARQQVSERLALPSAQTYHLGPRGGREGRVAFHSKKCSTNSGGKLASNSSSKGNWGILRSTMSSSFVAWV